MDSSSEPTVSGGAWQENRLEVQVDPWRNSTTYPAEMPTVLQWTETALAAVEIRISGCGGGFSIMGAGIGTIETSVTGAGGGGAVCSGGEHGEQVNDCSEHGEDIANPGATCGAAISPPLHG